MGGFLNNELRKMNVVAADYIEVVLAFAWSMNGARQILRLFLRCQLLWCSDRGLTVGWSNIYGYKNNKFGICAAQKSKVWGLTTLYEFYMLHNIGGRHLGQDSNLAPSLLLHQSARLDRMNETTESPEHSYLSTTVAHRSAFRNVWSSDSTCFNT